MVFARRLLFHCKGILSILGKFTLARETFGFKRFGSFQLPSSVNNDKHSSSMVIYQLQQRILTID